jgi:hypothetical protein
MKLKTMYRGSTLLTVLLTVLVMLLGGLVINNYIASDANSVEKGRDAIRISDIDQIHQAVKDYYTSNNVYPTCLYKDDCKKSLEGTTIMPTVARDPLTQLKYNYASYGPGSVCKGYHLGASLERPGSQALLTGSDQPPQPDSALCAGSSKDFSGLSYAPGGQPCNAIAGTAAPAATSDAETCYDIAHEISQPTTSNQ